MELIVEGNYYFDEEVGCPVDCCVVDCDFCGIDGGCFVDVD